MISTLANGVVTSPAIIQLNSITSFSCNTGYYLSGPSSIKCVPVGAGINWNASPPVCTSKTTYQLQMIRGTNNSYYKTGYICPAAFFTSTTGTPVAGSYLSLTSYNFNCGTNYVSGLNPNVVFDSYYCNALGSWSTTFTPCLSEKNKFIVDILYKIVNQFKLHVLQLQQ